MGNPAHGLGFLPCPVPLPLPFALDLGLVLGLDSDGCGVAPASSSAGLGDRVCWEMAGGRFWCWSCRGWRSRCWCCPGWWSRSPWVWRATLLSVPAGGGPHTASASANAASLDAGCSASISSRLSPLLGPKIAEVGEEWAAGGWVSRGASAGSVVISRSGLRVVLGEWVLGWLDVRVGRGVAWVAGCMPGTPEDSAVSMSASVLARFAGR